MPAGAQRARAPCPVPFRPPPVCLLPCPWAAGSPAGKRCIFNLSLINIIIFLQIIVSTLLAELKNYTYPLGTFHRKSLFLAKMKNYNTEFLIKWHI